MSDAKPAEVTNDPRVGSDVEGGTELTLSHDLLPVAMVGEHENGWTGCLTHLEAYVASA